MRLNSQDAQDEAKTIESEMEIMQSLRHDNIVALLGVEVTRGKLNILMEYVPGKSLDTLLARFGAFSEKVVGNYAKQLLVTMCVRASLLVRLSMR